MNINNLPEFYKKLQLKKSYKYIYRITLQSKPDSFKEWHLQHFGFPGNNKIRKECVGKHIKYEKYRKQFFIERQQQLNQIIEDGKINES